MEAVVRSDTSLLVSAFLHMILTSSTFVGGAKFLADFMLPEFEKSNIVGSFLARSLFSGHEVNFLLAKFCLSRALTNDKDGCADLSFRSHGLRARFLKDNE
jgi:hypothetical protein